MISKFYHVGVNVRNLDRSIAFYKMMGFEVAMQSELRDPELARMFGLKRFGCVKFAIMRQSKDPNGTMLDVCEFVDPPTTGEPLQSLNVLGISRLCFHVPDIQACYKQLQEAGVEFFYPLELIPQADGSSLGMMFFRDPDGNMLEVMDWKAAP